MLNLGRTVLSLTTAREPVAHRPGQRPIPVSVGSLISHSHVRGCVPYGWSGGCPSAHMRLPPVPLRRGPAPVQRLGHGGGGRDHRFELGNVHERPPSMTTTRSAPDASMNPIVIASPLFEPSSPVFSIGKK
ncbi:MAG: hypothetical protein K0S98_2780 [Propionibacteriaceae bacterium]|nr:hypothetical protein [Propionibacteriaceae bacterium]